MSEIYGARLFPSLLVHCTRILNSQQSLSISLNLRYFRDLRIIQAIRWMIWAPSASPKASQHARSYPSSIYQVIWLYLLEFIDKLL